MDSQKGLSTSYDLSYDVKYKPIKWYTHFLSNSSASKSLYNTRLITQEYEPDVNWRMPEIEPSKIYDLPMFKFKASTLFRYCSYNVPLSLGQSVYQIPLIQQSDIDWGLEHGFKYVHLGLIQFGINPLIRPGLNTSILSCVIDSHHNKFSGTLISGFQAPLHNGPIWSSALPRFQVSLTDPYISSLLQAYVQFSGFDIVESSDIAQLHTTTCLRFVSTTMSALNPKLVQRATNESMVVGLGNVTPLTLGFTKLIVPEEWSVDYHLVQSRITPATAQQLMIDKNESGDKVLRIRRPQSLRIPELERQMSSVSASTSDSYSRRPTSSSSSHSTPSRSPVYKPVANRSKLDDHLLFHQKGSENCYFCQKGIPAQKESTNEPPVSTSHLLPRISELTSPKLNTMDNILTVMNVKKSQSLLLK